MTYKPTDDDRCFSGDTEYTLTGVERLLACHTYHMLKTRRHIGNLRKQAGPVTQSSARRCA